MEATGVWMLAEYVKTHLPVVDRLPPSLLYIIVMFAAGAAVLTFVMLYAMAAIWAERKVSGHIQNRLGPMRVGWHGWLQSLADGIKLILKEDIIPAMVDKPLFVLAPCFVFCASFMAFVTLPFSGRLVIADLNIGILYITAMSSLVVVGVIMAGWASNSKWPLYGAMRAAAHLVSYEVPLGLSILPVIMLTGSLSMQDITHAQGGGFLNWFIFHNPFLFLAFWVHYIAGLAEVNRMPFDIAEAESELVGGYHTEYSGMLFSLFFMAEYADMFMMAAISTTLFLGGWNPPGFVGTGSDIPAWAQPFDEISFILVVAVLAWFGLRLVKRQQLAEFVFQAVFVLFCYGFWMTFPHLFWFLAKAFFLVWVMLWVRWTVPRLRIDQLMHLCWKVLTPLAFINILGTGIWYLWRY